jgi:hypothetical protein
MNTGVLISPWDVVIFPRRPAVSAPVFVKEKLNTLSISDRELRISDY